MESNGTSYAISLKENAILKEMAEYLDKELDELTANNKVDYAVVYGEIHYAASSWSLSEKSYCKG